jgi:signal transduction histidine kinase
MSHPDVIDTRRVLLTYRNVAFLAGLLVVSYPWPMPTPLSRTPVLPNQLWSLSLVVTSAAIWASAGAAAGLAAIDNPLARRWWLRAFGAWLVIIGLLCCAPGVSAAPAAARGVTPWLAIAAGAILQFLSLETRPRVQVDLADAGRSPGTLVVHDKRGTLRSQYEEQIRQAARQEERARLARDLHDAVKQQLFVIQTAAATVEARFGPDPDGARDALTQVRSAAREALAEMEVMLEQLQAAPLSNAGLVESLKRQCEVTRFRTGAEVVFDSGPLPPDASFPPGAHQALLRFGQEALANVARHARARHVRVALTATGGRVEMSVTDDGQGFDVRASAGKGIGLTSMAVRAAEASGVLQISSTPGTGTAVTLTTETYTPERKAFLVWTLLSLVALVALGIVLLETERSGNTTFRPLLLVGMALDGAALLRFGAAWRRMRP